MREAILRAMYGSVYPAARTFAARLEDYFAKLSAPGAERGAGPIAADASAIEAMIDAGFWASLQREEGYAPEISLAFLPPERAGRPLRLKAPLTLGPRALARLAPAVERPGIHLGVWREQERFVVWGTTREIPGDCFVLEVLGPGLLVVKHRAHEDSPKFWNVAVFEGDQVKILSRDASHTAGLPPLLQALLAPDPAGTSDEAEVLLRLAVSMRAHKRGGTLLVTPAGDDAWRESIESPITYGVAPPFAELADRLREAAQAGPWHGDGALGRVVDAVAGLTAVDGATLITDRYELLAFGVKIGRPQGRPRVERLMLSEPVEDAVPAVVAPLQVGGTRHASAAQFAQDQPRSLALVASQDGRFTVFAWCAGEGMVHAHRVETLLL